jgi:hypothetical protein
MIAREREQRITIDPQTIQGDRHLHSALAQLSHAAACARDAQGDRWNFAVEITSLLAAGLTTSDLRWLASKGYLEHAYEVTRPQDVARKFRPCRNLCFSSQSCFVLTAAGVVMAGGEVAQPSALVATEPAERDGAAGADRSKGIPSWDAERRILRLGGCIVKRFKVPSPTQQAILTAFQEEGWPPAIDDPLPPHVEQDPKRRLRNTVQSLNANQKNSLLHFRGDGSGERVLWELVADTRKQLVVKGRKFTRAA